MTPAQDGAMKAVALLVAVLALGDVALDHGAGVRIVLVGGAIFAEHLSSAFHDSIFSA